MSSAQAMRGGGGGGGSQAVLLLGWGEPVPGREQQIPQILSEAKEYAQRLVAQGDIQGSEAIALEPHGRHLQGLLLFEGPQDRINALRASQEFQRLVTRTQLIATAVQVLTGGSGGAFDQRVQEIAQQSRELR